jgi:hypothetical protein
VYKYTMTFQLIDSFPAPGGYYPNGLAFRGECLWLANAGMLEIHEMCQIPLSIPQTSGIETKIYPNPARNFFNIVGQKEIARVKLYSEDGHLIRTSEVNGMSDRINFEGVIARYLFVGIDYADGTSGAERLLVLPD